jgi:hypothetical protein
MEDQLFASEYDNQTTIHPVGAVAVLICGLLILVLPRKYAIWPMIVMACFVSQAQRIVIFTLDFNMLRIMVVFGWMRLLLRSEILGLKWQRLDWVIILWAAVRTFAPSANGMPMNILIGQLGRAFDAIGMYFLFRMLIRNWDDVKNVIRGITLISIPVGLAFAYEAMTARNLFAFFGGLPDITPMRGERLRCQGAFAHPILAGCFWASALPVVIAQLVRRQGRIPVILSVLSILLIVFACASSTPLMTVLLAFVGLAAFVVRYHMRLVRWCIVGVLCALALAMNKPVWHLLARVDVVTGSTGWHRYKLIDAAIEHADEWFISGSNRGSAHWGYGLHDITNDYVVQAMQGGIVQLVLFVTLIVLGYRTVGRLWRSVAGDREKLWLAWGLGVCLFTHSLNFIAVTYFGQIILMWYLLLAIIGSLTPARQRVRVRRKVVVRRAQEHEMPLGQSPAMSRLAATG